MFTALLDRTATVTRPTVVSYDDYGNQTVSFSAIYTDVPCRFSEGGSGRPGSSGESLDDRDTLVRTGTVFFDPDVELTFLDKIIIDGETWEVTGSPVLLHGRSGPHHTEAPVRKVNP